MTTTPTPASQQSPAPEIEKLARAVVATYDDPHLSPVAVERAIGMLRDALEQPTPARSDKDAERCPHCDGTGDVHRADGEWLGACDCEAQESAPSSENVWANYLAARMAVICALHEKGMSDKAISDDLVVSVSQVKVIRGGGSESQQEARSATAGNAAPTDFTQCEWCGHSQPSPSTGGDPATDSAARGFGTIGHARIPGMSPFSSFVAARESAPVARDIGIPASVVSGGLDVEAEQPSPAPGKMSAAEDNKYELPGDMGENWSPARSDTITVEVTQAFVNGTEEPARSDKDADRAKFEAWLDQSDASGMSESLWKAWQAGIAAKAQESAPSGEMSKVEIDEIVYQCRQSGNDTTYDIVRAALARRATAGTTAAPSSEIERLREDLDLANEHLRQAVESIAKLKAERATAGNAAPEKETPTICSSRADQAQLDTTSSDARAPSVAQSGSAGNAAPTKPVYFFRQKGTDRWIESEVDPRESFADSPVRLCMEYRTLYPAPVATPAATAAPGDLSKLQRYEESEGGSLNKSANGDWVCLDDVRELLASNAGAAPGLTVWEGPMPESNGKSNFTAILVRKGGGLLDNMMDGITIERSEYPDRVRYEADRVRYLIGERAERPEMWDKGYDFEKHSGYAAPSNSPVGAKEQDK